MTSVSNKSSHTLEGSIGAPVAKSSGGSNHKNFIIYSGKFRHEGSEYEGLVAPNTQFFRWRKDRDSGKTIYTYFLKETKEQMETTKLWDAVRDSDANFVRCPCDHSLMIPQGWEHLPTIRSFLKSDHPLEYRLLEDSWKEQEKEGQKGGKIFIYVDCFSAKQRFFNKRIPDKSFETKEELLTALRGSYPEPEQLCPYDLRCNRVGRGCPYNHSRSSWCPTVEESVRTGEIIKCTNFKCGCNHAKGRIKWSSYMSDMSKLWKAEKNLRRLKGEDEESLNFDEGEDDDSSCASTATRAALNVIEDKDEQIELLTKQISEIKSKISESKVNLEKRNNSTKESASSGTKAPAKSSGKKSGSSVTTTDRPEKKVSKNAAKKAARKKAEKEATVGEEDSGDEDDF